MVRTTTPPILRYVYAYPSMIIIVLQDMREGVVTSIVVEKYKTIYDDI
jgi:hypothetical protein